MNNLFGLTITGLVSGIFAGFIGGGAEIIIVPLLTFFSIFPSIKDRIATSLYMLLPPIGLFAAINFYKKGLGDFKAGLYMALIFTIASLFSSYININLDVNILRKIFGIFTILSGLYIYFNTEN